MRYACAWSAAALAASLAAPTISARQAGDAEAQTRAVRALLEAGRYEEADTAASALAAEVDGASAGSAAVRELQVEARVRNGRGAESETLALARTLAPDRASVSADADAGRRVRLLGGSCSRPVSIPRPLRVSSWRDILTNGHADRSISKWRRTWTAWPKPGRGGSVTPRPWLSQIAHSTSRSEPGSARTWRSREPWRFVD